MAHLELASTRNTVAKLFRADEPPVLSVDPGDTITVHGLDTLGHLGRFSACNEGVPRLVGESAGLTVAGPTEVRGPTRETCSKSESWRCAQTIGGWTMSSWQHSDLERRLGAERTSPTLVTWDLDVGKLEARSSLGLTVDLNPFLGLIGVSPAGPGERSLVPPHAGGGNVDCRLLGQGASLFLPIEVPGAMLLVGDGHGAQGDGEVSGTAIECAVTSSIQVDLIEAAALPTTHSETPEGRVTFGLSADLNKARPVPGNHEAPNGAGTRCDADVHRTLARCGPADGAGIGERCCRLADHSGRESCVGVHAVLGARALRRELN